MKSNECCLYVSSEGAWGALTLGDPGLGLPAGAGSGMDWDPAAGGLGPPTNLWLWKGSS